ncbi:hypothetical protein DFJ73DRAFT_768003, partial [Zopfochytrium polystomum]
MQTTSTFAVPASRIPNPQGAITNGLVGISFEFFAFPEYFNATAMPLTAKCLANLANASSWNLPTDSHRRNDARPRDLRSCTRFSHAPASLTYGNSFMDVAAQYEGDFVTLGLNRRLNQLSNTEDASKYAVSKMANLFALELGNEPEFYGSSSPIAGGATWNPTADANSQITWQKAVGATINKSNIIQAGVRLQPQFGWSIAQIVPFVSANGTSPLVTSFGEHSYPQSACGGAATNLTDLVSHKSIVNYCKQYASESAAARSIGKHYFISETNSAPYSWWGRNTTFAPYYGAIFAATALADATSIQAMDDGTTPYAAYAIYTSASSTTPSRILLYNSDTYSGSGTRSSRAFQVTGLPTSVSSVTGLRLTGPSTSARVETGGVPSISGLSFSNADCGPVGAVCEGEFCRFRRSGEYKFTDVNYFQNLEFENASRNANPQGPLTNGLVGISFEFFAFPEYFNATAMPLTTKCLANLASASSGTDRATYSATQTSAVSYTVSSPTDAPASLTYGKPFIDIAAQYQGAYVTLGLNRRLNQLSNTVDASKYAASRMTNLYAFELGNEPEFYGTSSPIAGGGAWNPTVDANSQVAWQKSVGAAPASACSPKTGVPLREPVGKRFTISETNSATCGGGGISPTFGAALWVVDYTMQLIINGADAIFFHHGTIGNSPYSWWGRSTTFAPYYGAIFAATALADAKSIQALDDGTTPYAAYAIYTSASSATPSRILLYNSDFYSGSGSRASRTFQITGVPSSVLAVTGLRLTGPSTSAKVETGGVPSISGPVGVKRLETFAVAGGA